MQIIQVMILLVFINSDIEAECQDDYMKIRIGFNGSFTGLLYSAGKPLVVGAFIIWLVTFFGIFEIL